jgi:hypothetical protein
MTFFAEATPSCEAVSNSKVFINLQQRAATLFRWRTDMKLPVHSVVVLLVLLLGICANGQAPTDFTGDWREQAGSRSQRHLAIKQNGQMLQVNTTVTTSKGSRHLEVTYQIGGPETVYKGLDGDEFHSSVHWNGNALLFDTVEHEDGKELPETTIWTLSEDRNRLQVKRQSTKSAGNGESLTTYVRQ